MNMWTTETPDTSLGNVMYGIFAARVSAAESLQLLEKVRR